MGKRQEGSLYCWGAVQVQRRAAALSRRHKSMQPADLRYTQLHLSNNGSTAPQITAYPDIRSRWMGQRVGEVALRRSRSCWVGGKSARPTPVPCCVFSSSGV